MAGLNIDPTQLDAALARIEELEAHLAASEDHADELYSEIDRLKETERDLQAARAQAEAERDEARCQLGTALDGGRSLAVHLVTADKTRVRLRAYIARLEEGVVGAHSDHQLVGVVRSDLTRLLDSEPTTQEVRASGEATLSSLLSGPHDL